MKTTTVKIGYSRTHNLGKVLVDYNWEYATGSNGKDGSFVYKNNQGWVSSN